MTIFAKGVTTLFLLFTALFVSQASETRLNETLQRLDNCIKRSAHYDQLKSNKIKKLQSQLKGKELRLQERYLIFKNLHTEFQSYKYDSAYSYANKMLEIAIQLKNPNQIAESKINLSFSCVSAGLYKEAFEIANSIEASQLDRIYKANYYSFLSTLNLSVSDFSSPEPYYSAYRMNALYYCTKSIEIYEPGSKESLMAQMRKCQLQINYDEAIRLAKKILDSSRTNIHEYAIVTSSLGFFYSIKKDTTLAAEYFALAAIADIQPSTKETSAIRQLAELIFERGDIQRAYVYANTALENANFYNARQRKLEVGRILPIIEAGRFAIIKEQKDKLLIYAGLISLLFILFVVATIIILKQKKRLNKARLMILKQNEELQETNEQLTDSQKRIIKQNLDLTNINEKLKEVDRIKDEYIGYFFSTNSAYLEKIEEYRIMVARKIKNRQFEELSRATESSDLRKEKEELFLLFDQIFMKIFPDFVERYNQLFEIEDRFVFKSDGTLSPEIRIFALIRLGISESERIAKFLDFSLSTVKNYKTKAKNRSIVPNELFEQKIMEIDSVKTDITDKKE